MVVGFGPHPDPIKWLDPMGLLGKDQPRGAGIEDHFGIWIEQLIAQAYFKHTDDGPRPGFCAVFAAQAGRKAHLIEDLRDFIRR